MTRAVAMSVLIAILMLVVVLELSVPDDAIDPVVPRPVIAASGKGPSLDTTALPEAAATIDARPLPSPTRRLPGRPLDAAATPSDSTEHGLPRLAGVIIGPSGGRAIFAGADGKSHTASEGDAVGPFKVRSIGPGLVVLSGAEGDRVLHPDYIRSLGTPGALVPDPAPNPAGPNPAGPNPAGPYSSRARERPR